MNHLLALAGLSDPTLLYALFLLVVCGCVVSIIVITIYGQRRTAALARKQDEDRTSEEEICEEDADDADTGPTQLAKEKDREDAARWWSDQQLIVSIVLDGPSEFEVEGKGTVEVDGTREEVDGKKKYESASVVEIQIDGKVSATFAGGGSARVAEVGEVKIEGAGQIDIGANGNLSLSGSARYVVSRCAEVSVSFESKGLVFEAHDCVAVFGGNAKEFFAYDCEKVYAQGCGFAYRCQTVSAQGNARVYAVLCADVSAMGKSKVRHRKCKNVRRSDDAVLEPVG